MPHKSVVGVHPVAPVGGRCRRGRDDDLRPGVPGVVRDAGSHVHLNDQPTVLEAERAVGTQHGAAQVPGRRAVGVLPLDIEHPVPAGGAAVVAKVGRAHQAADALE
ncbi:MAG: hypothetical protein ACRDUA_26135, partial [Micromonosporaceae bacterium]